MNGCIRTFEYLHSVAENFHVLAPLAPGRVDLGVLKNSWHHAPVHTDW